MSITLHYNCQKLTQNVQGSRLTKFIRPLPRRHVNMMDQREFHGLVSLSQFNCWVAECWQRWRNGTTYMKLKLWNQRVAVPIVYEIFRPMCVNRPCLWEVALLWKKKKKKKKIWQIFKISVWNREHMRRRGFVCRIAGAPILWAHYAIHHCEV